MNHKGFTLVELAIVLVIIGLLMGMSIKGKSLIDSARYRTVAVKMRNLETMAMAYYATNGALPPIKAKYKSGESGGVGHSPTVFPVISTLINSGYLSLADLQIPGVLGDVKFIYYNAYSDVRSTGGSMAIESCTKDSDYTYSSCKVLGATFADEISDDLLNGNRPSGLNGSPRIILKKHFCRLAKIIDGPPYTEVIGSRNYLTGRMNSAYAGNSSYGYKESDFEDCNIHTSTNKMSAVYLLVEGIENNIF